MKIVQIMLAALIVTVFINTAGAADTKTLLVGKWEAVKADKGTVAMGAVAEFTADGKLKLTQKEDGKNVTHENSYTVDGDSFTIKFKIGEQELTHKITIKKISETELDAADPDGKTVLFKRVK